MQIEDGGNWDGLSPEVLDMIFNYLPVPDLLSCSIISRNWKKAARDILKRRRACYAHIKYFHQDIQDLNEMIASTDIMEMINGLHIRNEKRPKEKLGSGSPLWQDFFRCSDVTRMLQLEEVERKLEEAKQKILGVLCGQWRHLDLDMNGEWTQVVSLDKGLLLREIILATSDTLEKLVVGHERDWKFIPCCAKPFPKLKVIQAQNEQNLHCCLDTSVSKFAPNLKRITGVMMDLPVPFRGELFILERMKNIKPLPQCDGCHNMSHWAQCPMPSWVVPRGEAKETFRAVSDLHRLDLQGYHTHPFDGHEEQNLVEWNACVFPFVLRSLNRLKELRMFTVDLHNLSMASDGLQFPNLRRISLATHWNASRANEISNLKNLNLPKLCPFLEQLELTEEHCIRDVEEEVIQAEEPDELDQSGIPVAVDLKCRYGQYNQEQITLLSTIYPKISKFRILKLGNGSECDASKIFLSSFWDLPSLEYLEISVPESLHNIQFHIEAFLSGINIEEAMLPSFRSRRKKDKLNLCIVPICPSLLNARSLTELKINIESHSVIRLRPLDRYETVSRNWVIEVTENLPERHVRNLKVTLDANKRLYHRLVRMRALTWLRANEIRAE